jgi:hypothetical protein
MNDLATLESLRRRLQVSLGAVAELGTELGGTTSRRSFAATSRENGRRVTVTVHAAPPMGPEPTAVARRIAQLRNLRHAALDLPIASGEVDGHAWVVDATPAVPVAADRLATGPLSLNHAVSAIRDLARALTAMHRCGIVHGAIDLTTVSVGPDGARLGGAALSNGGSLQGDLDDLGLVAWALVSGELHDPSSPSLSAIRRGVPRELDALCTVWLGDNPARRPRRAEAILEVLDAIPTRRLRAPGWIGDVVTQDGRPRPRAGWLLLGAGALVAIVLLALHG